MAQFPEFVKDIFSSKTKGGRINRTMLQVFIALTTIGQAALAIPEVAAIVAELPLIVSIGGATVLTGLLSAAMNYAKPLYLAIRGY